MSLSWKYPIFLLRHGGGYASVGSEQEDDSHFAVVVFTSRKRLERFVEIVELESEPRRIESDREFAQFLRGLRPPFTEVAFDSRPEGTSVNAAWRIDVESLLADHLPLADSPWDYPVYVLARGEGLASIEGEDNRRGPLVAVGLFTTAENAERYRDATDGGDICEIPSPAELADLLGGVRGTANAVAIDPVADKQKRTARQCVDIETLVEKYLPGVE